MLVPKFLLLYVLLVSLRLENTLSHEECNEEFLIDAIKALKKSVYYLGSHKKELILDAALGFRTTIDQLNVANERALTREISEDIVNRMIFVEDLAKDFAVVANTYVKNKNPKYWGLLGHIAEPGMYRLTHSHKTVNRDLMNPNPVSCNQMLNEFTNILVSDQCIAASNKNFFINTTAKCRLPDFCLRNMSFTGYKYYGVTHQLIDLALAETNGCLKDLEKFTDKGIDHLVDVLIANVLRDAEAVKRVNYPWELRDIFLEQIMIGGIFGYLDFLRRDWLDKIMKWQNPNGGFFMKPGYTCVDDLDEYYNTSSVTRVKRNELVLSDGGSMHLTSVAMNALTSLLRLCVDIMPEKE